MPQRCSDCEQRAPRAIWPHASALIRSPRSTPGQERRNGRTQSAGQARLTYARRAEARQPVKTFLHDAVGRRRRGRARRAAVASGRAVGSAASTLEQDPAGRRAWSAGRCRSAHDPWRGGRSDPPRPARGPRSVRLGRRRGGRDVAGRTCPPSEQRFGVGSTRSLKPALCRFASAPVCRRRAECADALRDRQARTRTRTRCGSCSSAPRSTRVAGVNARVGHDGHAGQQGDLARRRARARRAGRREADAISSSWPMSTTRRRGSRSSRRWTRCSTPGAASHAVGAASARSLERALSIVGDSNLALVSIPGEYVASEARRLLDRGIHAFVFSDNVSVEDEVALKRAARERGLLVMGPDCGTASLGGLPSRSPTRCREGSIGLVGASGTGLQEVMVQIDRLGGGVSHAIGLGGRDLGAEVRGISCLQALRALDDDAAHQHDRAHQQASGPERARRRDRRRRRRSPSRSSRTCSASRPQAEVDGNVHYARTLEETARVAVELAGPTRLAARGASPRAALDQGALHRRIAGRRGRDAPRRRARRGRAPQRLLS